MRTLSYDVEVQDDGRYRVRVLLKDSDTGALIEDLTDRPELMQNARNVVREFDPDAVFVEEEAS